MVAGGTAGSGSPKAARDTGEAVVAARRQSRAYRFAISISARRPRSPSRRVAATAFAVMHSNVTAIASRKEKR
jgi:hypothetical protein